MTHSFFRAQALAAQPYTLNEPENPLRLHQNEGTPLSSEIAQSCARRLAESLAERPQNLYPNLVPQRLISAYARYVGVEPNQVEVTSGSSQGLALLAQACFESGRTVAITSPSFSLFEGFADLHGASVVPIELSSTMSFERNAIFRPDVLNADVSIFCSPNNPTGGLCPTEWIEEFARKTKGLVVVDEAYMEFAEPGGARSLAQIATQFPNLLVLRTLSKAWAAAGLRIGAMIGNEEIISVFRTLKPPYSIPYPSEVIATHLLEDHLDDLRGRVASTVAEKEKLENFLRSLDGIELFESHANFVCFRHPRASGLEKHLRERHKILVRNYTRGRLKDVVRASLWTPKENSRFLDAMKEFFNDN